MGRIAEILPMVRRDDYKGYSDTQLLKYYRDEDPCSDYDVSKYYGVELDYNPNWIDADYVGKFFYEFKEYFVIREQFKKRKSGPCPFRKNCDQCIIKKLGLDTFKSRFNFYKKMQLIEIPTTLTVRSIEDVKESMKQKILEAQKDGSFDGRLVAGEEKETITTDDMKDMFQEALNDMEE